MRSSRFTLVLAAAATVAALALPVRAEADGAGVVETGAAEVGVGCAVRPAASAPVGVGEVAGARAACRRARVAFTELLGEVAPEVSVVLWDRGGYRTGLKGDTAVVFWPVERTRAFPADPARLPHEIAHVLLAARFYGGAEVVAGEYGTPLPDWFEEAVAIWAEPEDQRARRVADARTLPAERRELRSILSSAHPGSGSAEVLAVRDGAAMPADRALWEFYPRSIALLSFVHEYGGRVAVRTLAARLRADPDDARGLAGLPGLPADAAGVQRAWETWIASADPAA